MVEISKDCIHCGICTRQCSFLEKYNLDLQAFEEREDLALHCFQCGQCKLVCPVGIDGREISLRNRRKNVSHKTGKMKFKNFGEKMKYSPFIMEKRNYPFKNYKNVEKGGTQKKTVLFTGCNMLSYMPETTDRIIEEMKKYSIDTVFDCCSKPIYELGMDDMAKESVFNLKKRLDSLNAGELVLICPNCYYFLKKYEDILDMKLTDIYTKIEELGMKVNRISGEGYVFEPCPDRESGFLKSRIAKFADMDFIDTVSRECCGAGGLAGIKEGELSLKIRDDLKETVGETTVYTYCATCTSFLRQRGINTRHVLSEMFGVDDENPGNSLMNRIKYRFYRDK